MAAHSPLLNWELFGGLSVLPAEFIEQSYFVADCSSLSVHQWCWCTFPLHRGVPDSLSFTASRDFYTDMLQAGDAFHTHPAHMLGTPS